jgi:glutamate dehydrogenase (NAD(P)+)
MTGLGARLLAVNDVDGTIYNPDGIDVHALIAHVQDPKNLKRSVVGFPGAQKIEKKDFWEVPAEILIPAALGGEITGDLAERLKCKLIAEGANGPTTPEADRILLKRGIDLIPDIIANAGGVTVSYYEWIQNKRMESWSEAEVNAKLEHALKRNYASSGTSPEHPERPRCTTAGRSAWEKGRAPAGGDDPGPQAIEAHYIIEGFSQ